MNKFVFCLFFLTTLQSYSQPSSFDSLDLSFDSSFEEEIIKDAISDSALNTNFLNLLMAMDSTYSLSKSESQKKKIDDFLTTLEKRAKKYNERKKVKYLFDEVHNRFFKKYELNSYFSDIFQTSTYNCVTGTALYAYVFDHFKVPYQIKETPTHVFLVAYPHRYNIYIETTIPGKSGSYTPSENMIRKAVDELVELKMITQEQVVSKGYNKAFNDYYYGDENISKEDLIGIQYYNKAIFHFNEKEYLKAYESIGKSRLFYKNEKTKFFGKGILAIIVEEIDFIDIANFKWFLAFSETAEDIDFIKYKLGKILSEDSWTDKEHDIIEQKLMNLGDGELKNELLETLYSFRADRFSKLQLHRNTLEYAEKIYRLNPNNLNAKNYICESEIMSLGQKNMTEERLNDLTELTNRYPFIRDFGVYNRYKIYLYAFLTANSFESNNSNEGLDYLNELEDLMNEQEDKIDFSQEAVGHAYGSVGAYYYRKQNKSKAVDYLKRGLKYSPDNENINRKLRLIKNSL